LQFVVRRHHPLVIFGMLVSGWLVVAYGAALVTAQTVLPSTRCENARGPWKA
jgi:hypothetical protein